MAKRSRGTTTRPGQRRPMQRPATRPTGSGPRPAASTAAAPVAPRPTTLTQEEEARAGELEAAIVAIERAAETGRRVRSQTRVVNEQPRVSSLAVAAGNEYAYVARDVRRILTVAGPLLGLLVVLWVVVQATHITL